MSRGEARLKREQLDLESLIFGKDILEASTSSKRNKRSHDGVSSGAGLSGGGAVWCDEEDDVIQIDLNSVDRLKKLKTFVETDEEEKNSDDEVGYGDDDSEDEEARAQRRKAKTLAVTNGRNPDILFGSELSERLKSRFETQQHSWAQVKIRTHEESLDALLQSESGMSVKGRSSKSRKEGPSGRVMDRNLTPLTNSKINIRRCTDVNIASPGAQNATISTLQFHPTRPDLVLVGDSDRYLKLFRIAPQGAGGASTTASNAPENECEINIKMADMSIHRAEFLPSRSPSANSSSGIAEIIATGRKPFFYSYDTATGNVTKHTSIHKEISSYEHMVLSPGSLAGGGASGPIKMAVAGASGYIHLLDAQRKTWITDLKMNTGTRSMCFYDDNTFISSGVDAGVYIWDLRNTARCMHKFTNEDGTASTSLAIAHPSASMNGRQTQYSATEGPKYLAIGSESGVVSLFDVKNLLPVNNGTTVATNTAAAAAAARAMRPYKSCMNLSTVITSMAMHSSNQLLAMASDRSRDQLRLVHLPSGTVYSNWPTDKTPFRRVTSLAFSNSSGNGASSNNNNNYLAVGNNKGKVLLYQINHQL